MTKDKEEWKDLEETTDLLKSFKPSVGEEEKTEDLGDLYEELTELDEQLEEEPKDAIIPDYSEEEMVTPIYEDVDTLESAPIPSYPAKKEEKKEEEKETSSDQEEKKLEEKSAKEDKPASEEKKKKVATKKITRKMKKKRLGKILVILGLLGIPGLASAWIVSCHSHLLINEVLAMIALVLLIVCLFLTGYGSYLWIQNRKAKTIRPKKIIWKVLYAIFMTCYVSGCVSVLVLLYGPYNGFRDWLVTTAMATMHHTHYCKWFYNDEEIEEVFSRNYIKETGESTDPDLVDTETPPQEEEEEPTYANEYERTVLEHNPEDIYKLVTFDVNGCKAYLAIIYDPSKVGVTTTKYLGTWGEYVVDMAKRENALIAINGAGFQDPGHSSTGGRPVGITIVDHKIITNNEFGKPTSGGLIGFTDDNKLVLLKNATVEDARSMGVRDAVSWGPFLIVNGKAAYTKGNGGWGYAARTAIGQRADGIVLMLVVDSNANRSKGANMVNMTEIMQQYGAINAANLDGGTSSVIVENGKLINDPIDSTLSHRTRPIATAFIVTK